MKLKTVAAGLGIVTSLYTYGAGQLSCGVYIPSHQNHGFEVAEEHLRSYPIDSVYLCLKELSPDGGAVQFIAGGWNYRGTYTVNGWVDFRTPAGITESQCTVVGDTRTLASQSVRNLDAKRSLGFNVTLNSGTAVGKYRVDLVTCIGSTADTCAISASKTVTPPSTYASRMLKYSDMAMSLNAGDTMSKKLVVTDTVASAWDHSMTVKYTLRNAQDDGPVVTFEDGTDTVTLPAPDAPTVKVQVPESLGSGTYTRVLDATVTCP
jgi:hypothetical protein